MRKIYLLLFVALALFLASCENTSKPRFDGDVYTVAGLLVSGQAISLEHPVYVTRSTSIEDFDPWQIFVMDAVVTIRDTLTHEEFPLVPALDEMKVKYIDPAGNLILAEHTYRIEVQVPGYEKQIWAETTVPISVELEPDLFGTNPAGTGYSFDPETQNTMPYSDIDSMYPLVLNTGANSGSYNLYGEVYCLEDFSTDLEFTNPVLGITHPDSTLADMYNSGGMGFRRVNFLGKFVTSPVPGLGGNYLQMSDYSTFFALYGRYRMTAYVIDDNYYKYTFMPDGYFYGGVHNALGYFGSASGGVMYTRIVK